MKVIDSDNYAASGIDTLFFPGGEPHARVPIDFGDALLFLKARTWNDLGKALVVLDALQVQRDVEGKETKVWVFAAYFPAARQDRSDGQTPMTCDLMHYMLGHVADKIFTFDVHSPRTSGHNIKNFTIADLIELERAGQNLPPMEGYVIAPDKGAVIRAQQVADAVGLKTEVIVCEKVRDFSTGQISSIDVPPLPAAGQYIIVDDICDGGRTFNLIAQSFIQDQYGQESGLALWVSHGIFSKGLDAIDAKITEIGTTDSWCNDLADSRLDVISLQPLIDKIVESANV